jgi:hypothetical protein
MSTLTKLRVSFSQSIDNDDHQFSNKNEAIEIVKKMTSGNCGAFDWNVSSEGKEDPNPYLYLCFSEYVYIEVELDGSPLYTLIDEVKPVIEGGVYSSVKKVA